MAGRLSGSAQGRANAKAMGQAARSVDALRREAMAVEGELVGQLREVTPVFASSARNLAHYLAVRRHDIRDLQRELARLGLSSLGRMEAHVMASLDAVHAALCRLRGLPVVVPPAKERPLDFDAGRTLLSRNADTVLGPMPRGSKARIMVTMPGEAAEDAAIVRDLLSQGMNIMRINCAHDGPRAWGRMVAHLRQAERTLGLRCKVCFDLAGPKLRTGAIEPAEGVVKWRPLKNRLGQFVAPALVGLIGETGAAAPGVLAVPVRGDLIARARAGDTIELVDARGRVRALEVAEATAAGCMCRAERTAYVTEGVELTLKRKGRVAARGRIGALPLAPQAIRLMPGDLLDVVSGGILGRNALCDEDGTVIEPAVIGCALDAVFRCAKAGERIFFDDGKVAGVIRRVTPGRLRVEITGVPGGAFKLRDEKGINLPDTHFDMPALGPKDVEDLAFAVRHRADMVALSFVQRPADVEGLIAKLAEMGARQLGIVLKIETAQAFAGLPGLLLAAMRHERVAVMVARGDLGVEVGFERLSEVQEEILWLCEAAHVPVIWATQVLESLAKGGMPSRAEVTDAAMGTRAECVMLNKGPYILQTLEFLRDVLSRMENHLEKKTAMLRKLSISDMRADGARRSAA